MRNLQVALGRLTPKRRKHWLTLATFALCVGMKHQNDEDDFARITTELNPERWKGTAISAIARGLAEEPRPDKM